MRSLFSGRALREKTTNSESSRGFMGGGRELRIGFRSMRQHGHCISPLTREKKLEPPLGGVPRSPEELPPSRFALRRDQSSPKATTWQASSRVKEARLCCCWKEPVESVGMRRRPASRDSGVTWPVGDRKKSSFPGCCVSLPTDLPHFVRAFAGESLCERLPSPFAVTKPDARHHGVPSTPPTAGLGMTRRTSLRQALTRCVCRMEGARAPGIVHETCRACPARLMRGRRGRRQGTTRAKR
jgi:hypothetical protein